VIDGAITNDGLIENTSENGEYLVFAGQVDGRGDFDGNIAFAHSYSPGNSPGISTFGLNLLLAPTNVLTMEIGGPLLPPDVAEPQYDKLIIGGTFWAGGTLRVELIDIGSGVFQPTANQSFDLFDFLDMPTSFGVLDLPELDPGLTWDTSQLTLTGELSVAAIPEPSASTLCFVVTMGHLSLVLIRRCQSG
jgi:hypothetical protein